MSISVVINTYNASLHLDKVLGALHDFDEIVVCDMESTDNTREIALSHGARVVTFHKNGHNRCEPARNFAISQAKNEWVLVVDADELVPKALRRFLHQYIYRKNPANGLYIPRRNYIMDRFRRATYPDYKLRFFRKDCVNWPPTVHSVPEVKGQVGKIPANKMSMALIHIPPTLSGMLRRLDRYTSAEVEKSKGEKVTLLSLVSCPLFSFLNAYIIKGGYRYGKPGFIAASHRAVYELYRLGKIYEKTVKFKLPGEIEEEDTIIPDD